MELRYKGGAYSGWQRQPNAITVQGEIERALTLLLRTPIDVVGAGRTDSGVHASFYVAHFDYLGDKQIDTDWILYKLNVVLPHDIAIMRVYEVSEDMHARFSAVEREYTYVIEPTKNPFTREVAWQYRNPLDIDLLNEAASLLLTYSDFTTFAKLGSDNKTNICDVRVAMWTLREDGALVFTIRADRFLRNMIRAIVGTLVDVGRGRYSIEQFRDIIESQDLSRASTGAPAQGLFLSDVKY